MTFTVLHVCMGNICRSPMAERILRHELDSRFGAAAASVASVGAGTYAGHTGDPMNPPAAAALGRRGVDASGFRARGLESWMLADADLVLTATVDQVRRIAAMDPDAGARTFTLKELAALSVDVDRAGLVAAGTLEERFASLVLAADRVRHTDVAIPRDLDVADPYGEPARVFDATAAEIAFAVGQIVTALTPADGARRVGGGAP